MRENALSSCIERFGSMGALTECKMRCDKKTWMFIAVASGVFGATVSCASEQTKDAMTQTEVTIKVSLCDNLEYLRKIPSAIIDLIYIDPPFNTGRRQERKRFRTIDSSRVNEATYGYDDSFEDLTAFLEPRMREAYRVLKDDGSLFFHLDYREIHYCKVMLDRVFGRDSFMNEIIWAYDYGARSKNRWSAKHDNILWYAKNPKHYTFNYDDMDRIPYMAPELVGPEKAARGKTPTDVWWHTIVSPNSREKTGYATQKPRGILDRIVKIHSRKGDLLLDFFAGSGTLGESAYELGRNSILVDNNRDAIAVMKRRFEGKRTLYEGCDGIPAAQPRSNATDATVSQEAEGFFQPRAALPPLSAEGEGEKPKKKRSCQTKRPSDIQMELL